MLIERVEALRSDIERQYQLLVDALVRSSYLTSDTARTLAPHIEVQIVDQRKDQTVTLPPVRR
jgi:hypothetical protein